MTHVELGPVALLLVAIAVVVVVRALIGSTHDSRPFATRLALWLCVGGVLAVVALHVCLASASPMSLQERLATAALFMGMVGGLLYASVYRGGGDDPPAPGDDSPEAPDDPGGDHAYPWWPDFERGLRDYERQRERVGV